ncbi:hypothetical protein QGN29_10120 [Temperatibacter marinus]|uniref:Phosphatidate cytidylyltransferase n=1 Tax=Temperatibacter marinus TaxID=1456591 RepID=A0AA52EAU1_9PROT|nr:hypothetical protein [Temperatibacter marinus]WND01907.1 hypothetical protein QGN29_10120 [Temperatibacter marinus]
MEPKYHISELIQQEWQRPVNEITRKAAEDIARKYGDSVVAVLFYGSCLRTGEVEDRILDFYVIVDDYWKAYGKSWLARGNQLIPPNVFYHEIEIDAVVTRSKYAVISLDDFESRVQDDCLNVSIWARFCQPTVPLLVEDKSVGLRLQRAIQQACLTMLANALPMVEGHVSSDSLWVEAFNRTYASEVRSEPEGKGLEIYELDKKRYDEFYDALANQLLETTNYNRDARPEDKLADRKVGQKLWKKRARNGKIVSILRLMKASMTFDGGIDYLAWKIKRHSGVEIEVTERMRRFPIISGLLVFMKMRGKAFK